MPPPIFGWRFQRQSVNLVFGTMIVAGVITLAGFIGALLLIAHDWTVAEQISSRVRARHPEIWKALDSPDRYFDDGGFAKRSALERLFREPSLLRRCDPDIVGDIEGWRRKGRIFLRLSLVAFVVICLGLWFTR